MRRVLLTLAALLIAPAAHAQTDPHAGHVMPAPDPAPSSASTPPPPVPADHAADAISDPAEMARSRAMLAYESGGMPASMILIERLEYQAGKGADGYRWEGEGWFGGDIDRFVVKTEGEGIRGGALEKAEAQALYSHALDPWFNLQLGVRHDIRPRPQRSYAVVGVEGLAPYWFEIDAALFLSDKGDVLGRVEASYDQRITGKLILQPLAELNFAAQSVPESGIGSGLSDAELGLRLRYEFAPEFAPYVGVNWERKFGTGARQARAAGESASEPSLVLGVRFWF